MWPRVPTCPPTLTWSPMTVEPAKPVNDASAQCLPIRQLCPICTRLSIFVPAPIRVLPVCARSTHVFAPISTSSSSTTLPICGIRSSRPSINAQPKPSLPMTQPAWSTTRLPTVQRSMRRRVRMQPRRFADRRIVADVRAGADDAAAADRARAVRRTRGLRRTRRAPNRRRFRRPRLDAGTGRAAGSGADAANSRASAWRAFSTTNRGLPAPACGDAFVDQHGGRRAFERRREIAFVGGERQRAGSRPLRPR